MYIHAELREVQCSKVRQFIYVTWPGVPGIAGHIISQHEDYVTGEYMENRLFHMTLTLGWYEHTTYLSGMPSLFTLR